MSDLRIERATTDETSRVAALFNDYRVFYGQDSDPEGATAFIEARLASEESVILLASAGDQDAGFTQLYPSFSSVSMAPIWILNDLYVAPDHRRRGVASALLEAACQFGRESGARRLCLATAHDNTAAQSVYEQLGWTPETSFRHYDYEL